ncbi:histone-fold-containing protein [Thelonectria olida]|uniref:Histone H4 n=1 Tax=Thelonectria olida TaxID=1576542 RepID=A0A9P8WFJ4_9HYPO|nr:histone-fold-containing protein [Thelonectria olida]
MPPTLSHHGGPGMARTGAGRVGGKTTMGGAGKKRQRKMIRDSIHGVTKPAVRRLARRGGVKRISASIYDEARAALKARLETILKDCIIYVEHRKAKTVTVNDVIHALRRIGRPIYGFDHETRG